MKPIAFVLVLVAAATAGWACRRRPPAPTVETLAGRYVLALRWSGAPPQPDAFELKRDGSCLVDMGGRSGIAGTWHASPDGILTIRLGSSSDAILSYNFQLRKYALLLFPGEPFVQFYVRWPLSPARAAPPERELLGIQIARTERATIAQRMTADHRYELRERDLVPQDRTYYDISMRGTFTYADGIITYRPSESTPPVKIDYSNDFVVSREGACLWLVVPQLDQLTCVRRAMTLDLGPPPDGFRPGR